MLESHIPHVVQLCYCLMRLPIQLIRLDSLTCPSVDATMTPSESLDSPDLLVHLRVVAKILPIHLIHLCLRNPLPIQLIHPIH